MEDIRTLTLLVGSLVIFAGLVSLFWRENPSNEDAEIRAGISLSVIGLALLALAGLMWISTTLFLIGVVVAIIIALVAAWPLPPI